MFTLKPMPIVVPRATLSPDTASSERMLTLPPSDTSSALPRTSTPVEYHANVGSSSTSTELRLTFVPRSMLARARPAL